MRCAKPGETPWWVAVLLLFAMVAELLWLATGFTERRQVEYRMRQRWIQNERR